MAFPWRALWSLVALSTYEPALSHDSCCAKAAAMVAPSDVVMIPDMNARRPEGWDDEEDGPWERPLIPKPPDTALTKFLRELRTTLEDASPWLLLGLLVSGFVKAVTPTGFVQRRLSSDSSGHLPLAKGAFLGLMSPLCSCSALPMALGLVGTGASPGAAVAFVVSAQAAGVDSLLFTIGLLGLNCAIARMFAAGLLGVAAGFVTPSSAATIFKNQAASCSKSHDSHGWLQGIKRGLLEAVTDDFDEVAPSLMLGFSLTALIAALLPPGGLAQVALLGGLWGRASAIAVALPLQFCEHASVPLAVDAWILDNSGDSCVFCFLRLYSCESPYFYSFM